MEKKKPGLRAGYGRDLEKRLFQVEALIETHSRILENITQNQEPGNTNTGQAQDLPHTASNGLRGSYSTYSDSPQTTLSVTTQKNGRSDSFGVRTASPMLTNGRCRDQRTSPSPIQTNIVHSRGHEAFLAGNPQTNQDSLQSGQTEEFPPYDLLYSLVDLYFTKVNTWCPILDRKSTLQMFFGSQALVEKGERILLHAIVATTLRFSTDPRLSEQARKQYYDRSKQKVLLYGLENSTVRGLQAMVILALDLHGSESIGAGLKMIALIARSAIQLGLTTESSSPKLFPDYPSISTLRANVLPEPSSWIEDESRRRLFWMVYFLDRDATVATAFEFALDERDVDRRLPCRDDLFGKDQAVATPWFGTSKRSDYSMYSTQNLGAFSFQIEVRGLISEIHQFLKRPMDVSALNDVETWQGRYRLLDQQLRNWQLGLPHEYSNISRLSNAGVDVQRQTLTPGWILLQASYYL